MSERFRSWLRGLRLTAVIVTGMLAVAGCGGGGSSGGGGAQPPPAGNPPPTGTPPPAGEAQVDTTPPSPPAGLTAAATGPTDINVSWTAAPSAEGVTSYKVYRAGTLVATVQSTSHADAGLTAATQYCYDVTASDAAGNESTHSAEACATTPVTADTTAPTVTSTTPAASATNVAVDGAIRVVFSEPMNATALTEDAFKVTDADKNPVTGTVTYSGTTATFDPTDLLAASETYTVAIAADVQDVAGNAIGSAYSWTFKTGLAVYAITPVGEDQEGDDEEIFTMVADLNENGEVAGEGSRSWNLNQDNPSQKTFAFFWRDGNLIDLNANSMESRSQGLNDRSEVVGWSYQGVDVQPTFLWRAEQFETLPLNGANAINNAGQVAGYVNRTVNDEGFSVPVIWKDGQFTELDGVVNPWNINEAGDVVGFADVEMREQAVLWRRGVATLLGKLPNAESSQAFDINRAGAVVGMNNFAPPISPDSYNRAFIWRSGKMTELGPVEANHISTSAYGINDRGDVVGRSGVSQFVATIWLDGESYDLNDLIAADDPLKPYIKMLEAREINNRGQIIVQGTDSRRSGSYSGYLLTPKRAR